MTTPGGVITCVMSRLRRRTSFRPLALMLLLSVAAVCGACGGSDTAGSDSTSNASASTTTNPQTAAVVAAYRAEQAAFEEAIQNADPTLPALAQTMIGAQL